MARGNSRADSEYRGTFGNPQAREARAFRTSSEEDKRVKEQLRAERRNSPEYQAKLRKETAAEREKSSLRRAFFSGADLSSAGIELKKGSPFAEITDVKKFLGDAIDQIVEDGVFDSFSLKIEPGDLSERQDAANQRTLNAFPKDHKDEIKKGSIIVEVDSDDLPGDFRDFDEDDTPSYEWERSGSAAFTDALSTGFYRATGHLLSEKSLDAVSSAIMAKIESDGDSAHTDYHENRRDDDYDYRD
jgi:hypothetical protein